MSHMRKRCLASNAMIEKERNSTKTFIFCEKNGHSSLTDALAQCPLSYLLGKGRDHTFPLTVCKTLENAL